MRCPADACAPSMRPYTGLPDVTYRLHDRGILVTASGHICIMRKKINLSTVLVGRRIGIKEVDDGIWLVSFMSCDLEARTLQPLDSPFGTRLLPMS